MQIRTAIPMHGDENSNIGTQNIDEANKNIVNKKKAIRNVAATNATPRFLNFMGNFINSFILFRI